MAAFTTIAAATVAVGGQAAKGFLAGDAAKDAARAAGRLEIEQERLEQESVARLEQNFYDAIRATTDIYDKQLQLSNVQGSQILEAAQEGDQRGVAATAGKVKQVQDVGTGQIADKMAMQKLGIDMKRAEASEMDAARIAALQDDRAAAAGLEAKAKRNEADELSAASTGAFIDAGVSALKAGIGAFGGAEGRAAQKLVDSGEAGNLTDATNMVDGLGNKALRQISKSGTMTGLASKAGNNLDPQLPQLQSFNFTTPEADMLQEIGYENVNGKDPLGSQLIDGLKGIKNSAMDIFNIKNKNYLENTLDKEIEEAKSNPLDFLLNFQQYQS